MRVAMIGGGDDQERTELTQFAAFALAIGGVRVVAHRGFDRIQLISKSLINEAHGVLATKSHDAK